MSAATDLASAPAASAAPRPWWRGKIGLVVGIVLVIVISYIGWKGDYPWPSWLTWTALTGYLDNFQTWLSDQRNVPDPSFFFTIFNGVATFLDNLVSWLTSFFFKLTWVGTAAFGIVVVLRFGSRKRGARRRGGIRVVRADGPLGGERADLRPDDGGRLTVAADRDAARRGGGTLRPLPARGHAGARRDADRARVRLPDADRDPVLGRAGRGRRDDDDLRDPAGDPDHGARDPRSAHQHGRGGRGARLDQGPGAPEGAAPAGEADAAPLRQPGDPVRALDGRDRRADRRPRPRRDRHERHLLESRSGDPRRRRDRDHGDRARPLDRVDGRAHRSGAPPRHRSGQEAAAPRDARRGGHRCAGGRPRLRVRRRRDLLRADGTGVAARPDPVGARLHPEPGDRRVRDLVADRQCHGQVRPRADQHTTRPARRGS